MPQRFYCNTNGLIPFFNPDFNPFIHLQYSCYFKDFKSPFVLMQTNRKYGQRPPLCANLKISKTKEEQHEKPITKSTFCSEFHKNIVVKDCH
jgi:hypothetical protein